MRNVHNRLLAIVPFYFIILGCTVAAPSMPRPKARSQNNQILYLDLGGGEASANGWTARLVNCSNEKFYCLQIPEKMSFSFPRHCSDVGPGKSISTPSGELIQVSMDPHFRPPAGGYAIKSFPNELLYYSNSSGLNEYGFSINHHLIVISIPIIT